MPPPTTYYADSGSWQIWRECGKSTRVVHATKSPPWQASIQPPLATTHPDTPHPHAALLIPMLSTALLVIAAFSRDWSRLTTHTTLWYVHVHIVLQPIPSTDAPTPPKPPPQE